MTVEWKTLKRLGKGGVPAEITETKLPSGVRVSTVRLPDPKQYDGPGMEWLRLLAGSILGYKLPAEDDLFETLVFGTNGEPIEASIVHYKTIEEAEIGHVETVKRYE